MPLLQGSNVLSLQGCSFNLAFALAGGQTNPRNFVLANPSDY